MTLSSFHLRCVEEALMFLQREEINGFFFYFLCDWLFLPYTIVHSKGFGNCKNKMFVRGGGSCKCSTHWFFLYIIFCRSEGVQNAKHPKIYDVINLPTTSDVSATIDRKRRLSRHHDYSISLDCHVYATSKNQMVHS